MKTNSTGASLKFIYLFLLVTPLVSCNQKSQTNETALNSPLENAYFQSIEGENFYFIESDVNTIVREDTNVVLTVDTENITEENKNDYVVFSDDRSDPSENSGTPSEHVAYVDKNMKIYWSGVAKDPSGGATVDILEVHRKPEGGAEILEAVFRDPNKDGIVIGKIKNKKVSGLESYNIVIRVNGESPKTFVIDPKLKMTNTD